MEEKVKQRLIGVLVIIGALFIILPFLFHNSQPSLAQAAAANNTNTSAVANSNVSVTLPAEAASTAQNSSSNNSTPTTSVPATASSSAPAETSDNNTSVVASKQAATAAVGNLASQPKTTLAANSHAAPANTLPTPAAPTSASGVVSSATAPSIISASGLTKGEEDDQPTAMQKETANTMPVAPIPSSSSVGAKTTSEAQSTAASHPVAHHVLPIAHKKAVAHREERSKHGEYWVQVGAFYNVANAEHLMKSLRQRGFSAHTKKEFHHQHELVIVYVGSISNLRQAELDRARIDREFHLNGAIRKIL